MALDDAGDGGKPEAGALADVLGGEERVENLVDDVLRNAAAAVGYLQHDVRPDGRAGGYARVVFVDVEILGAKAELAAIGHRVARIDAEVEKPPKLATLSRTHASARSWIQDASCLSWRASTSAVMAGCARKPSGPSR